MLLGEFSKLTGFTPDEDYYVNYIENEYNNSVLEKREWCEQWIKKGGIQKAYNDLNDVCDVYKKSYEAYVRMYRGLRDDYEKLLKEKNALLEERNEALKKIESSKKALDSVIEKLNDLYKQRISEKDDLSVLITKLLEVKIS